MEAIKNFIEEAIAWIIWFYHSYRIISAILLVIAGVFFLVKFFSALAFDLKNIKDGTIWIGKKLWWLLKLPFKLFRQIGRFILWIFRFRQRYLYRRYLKESVFNVVPHPYKIPLRYKIFIRKVRVQKKNRLHWIERCFDTKENIETSIGFITMIEASIGGGKTSFLNGYAHMRTLLHKEAMEQQLYEIEKRLFTIDYTKIRELIRIGYTSGDTEEKIQETIMNKYGDSFKGTYNDYVSDIPKVSLLKKYVVTYCASLRNVYTMANYHMFNRITGTYNYDLRPDQFDVKDEESLKHFFIPSYCTIVDDEKALSDFKNTETPKELDKKGTDVIMRLFRQLRDETTYYISSTQNTSRIAMMIRELANTYISIQSFEIVGEQNRLANIYRKKESRQERRMQKHARRKFRNPEAREAYLLQENTYKRKIHHYFQKSRELYAAAYIRYRLRIANKLEDLKDENCSSEKDFVFPITWVFGVYRTCEYSDFYDLLMEKSEVKSDHALKVIESLFGSEREKYESMLASDKKKKTKKAKKEDEA